MDERKDERRAFLRLSSKLNATYKMADAKQDLSGSVVQSLTKDVGGGGIRLMTAVQFGLNTRLQVEVKFPDRAKPVAFTGEVVWSKALEQTEGIDRTRRFETGLRYVAISKEDQKYILQHANLHKPLQ